MKDTKLAAKKQEEVDKINKKRFATKSKTKVIPPPIIDSSSKPIFGEGVGKGDAGKGNNEIFIISLTIRFNIDNKQLPEIQIHISNK